jgi:SAM-dependent methyltransferase
MLRNNGTKDELYSKEFYKNQYEATLYAAETILSIVQRVIPEIKSAVDLGCGVGTWLHVLEQRGVTDICGVDGNWVNKDYLKIQKEHFIGHDLSKDTDPNIGRAFDLAISIEVAEHLPSNSAQGFVSLLTNLSDFVLFSAAIPYQRGVGHINKQWPNYWISLFEKRGYVGIDVIRKNIWNDKSIQYWYRQNVLLFVNKERIGDLKIDNSFNGYIPAEAYLTSFQRAIAPPGIKQSLNNLFLAARRRMRRMFGVDC